MMSSVNESKDRYIENEPVKAPIDSGNSVKSDSLKLLVTATDSCWVKALIDDSKKEEFEFISIIINFFQQHLILKFTFGNSYRVQLLLNNKPLKFEAKTKVSVVSIDGKGLNYLNPTVNQKQ